MMLLDSSSYFVHSLKSVPATSLLTKLWTYAEMLAFHLQVLLHFLSSLLLRKILIAKILQHLSVEQNTTAAEVVSSKITSANRTFSLLLPGWSTFNFNLGAPSSWASISKPPCSIFHFSSLPVRFMVPLNPLNVKDGNKKRLWLSKLFRTFLIRRTVSKQR